VEDSIIVCAAIPPRESSVGHRKPFMVEDAFHAAKKMRTATLARIVTYTPAGGDYVRRHRRIIIIARLTMGIRWFGVIFLVMVLALAGCRSRVETPVGDVAPEDTSTHLSDKTDFVLEDWLKLRRAEQAKLAEEWAATVEKQRQFARNNLESVRLLPQLHLPVMSAVFAEAAFSPSAGFSLPPYLKEGQKDAAVALHLARFGDHEAALKLADSADKDLLAKIDASRGEKNYSVEWTRLVSLILQNAELRLANGEEDGASDLVLLHRQLRSVLDAKATTGALGATLLSRGREALTQAAAAWRDPRRNKTALASDIDAALADWGPTPEVSLGLNAGAKKSEVVSFMGGEASSRAVTAKTPSSVQRTLDLLSLPLSSEGADGVAALLDEKQNLTQWLVVYRPKLSELLPEPRHLALPLVEHSYKSDDPQTTAGLKRQVWSGGGLNYEVSVLTRGNVGGAVVRVGSKLDAVGNLAQPRDFGVLHLDRSFEQNRITWVPDRSGASLEVKENDKLARIAQPASRCDLAYVVLQCEPNADLVAKLTLGWPVDRNDNSLRQLALPLWAAYGSARLESDEKADGGQFFLTWQDEATRLKLTLPFEPNAPNLVVEDNRGPSAIKSRVETAEALLRRERQERIAVGKAHSRLIRSVPLTSQGIAELPLGATRDSVRAVLPDAHSIRVQPLSDGWNILFLNEPPATATYWPRQLFVRFNAADRVAEIRVRYQEGPHATGPKFPSLLDTLKAKPNGAPQSLSASWAGLWTDLPTQKAPVFYRWLDDLTCLTYQRDTGGSEVILRDCPVQKTVGAELPPLSFCRRGIDGCQLGDNQSEVRRRWQIRSPLLAPNGAEVLVPPSNSRYDALLVWYENGKVSKLIARHKEPKTLKRADVAAALQQAWGSDLDHLGFLRRQDGALGPVLQAYSYHDDLTRVRLFAQETSEGIRLFTEWRDWPIASKIVASK
jgi:hypothetical protein